jgi:hypothetical protein
MGVTGGRSGAVSLPGGQCVPTAPGQRRERRVASGRAAERAGEQAWVTCPARPGRPPGQALPGSASRRGHEGGHDEDAEARAEHEAEHEAGEEGQQARPVYRRRLWPARGPRQAGVGLPAQRCAGQEVPSPRRQMPATTAARRARPPRPTRGRARRYGQSRPASTEAVKAGFAVQERCLRTRLGSPEYGRAPAAGPAKSRWPALRPRRPVSPSRSSRRRAGPSARRAGRSP